jgi:hypothetical protein
MYISDKLELRGSKIEEERKFLRNRIRGWKVGILIFGPAPILSFVGLEIIKYSKQIAESFLRMAKSEDAATYIGVSVVLIGLIAILWKKKFRMSYGIVELIFGGVGAAIIGTHVSSTANVIPTLLSIVGCIYVAVRGWTNIADAVKERAARPKVPWEEVSLEYINSRPESNINYPI